jgi:putative ABC transport system permease protein
MFVRTAGDPMPAARSIQQIVRSIDPKQPLSRIQTLEDVRQAALASPKSTTLLVALFAIVALIVTAAGIAGVVGFTVRQRTTEIGVRMALGAPRGTVIGMIVKQGLTPVAIGLGIGVGAAVPVAQAAGRLLYDVQPADPPTLAGVVVLLAGTAALACLLPARRAATIDPMQALRAE